MALWRAFASIARIGSRHPLRSATDPRGLRRVVRFQRANSAMRDDLGADAPSRAGARAYGNLRLQHQQPRSRRAQIRNPCGSPALFRGNRGYLLRSAIVSHVAACASLARFKRSLRHRIRSLGTHDDTAAIQAAINTGVANNWPVYIPSGTYKITSRVTVDYAGQSGKGFRLLSEGATLDGRTIASGDVLRVQCSGGK